MAKQPKIKVGDWVKYRSGGPPLANDVIGEVTLIAGYLDVLVSGQTVVISAADVVEVRKA